MHLMIVALGLCLLGAGFAALAPIRMSVAVAALLTVSGCVIALVATTEVLLGHDTSSLHTSRILPLIGTELTLDPLAAVFIATTAFVGLSASVYSIGYASGSHRSRNLAVLLPLFVGSLLAVPLASSVGTFFFAWEMMAVSSLLILVAQHRRRSTARDAAVWYGTMTQLGAAAILLGLLLLAWHSGGQTFNDIGQRAHELSLPLRSAAFLLVLLGFASKAGAVPLHVWLPRAHPEAPAPISALMSGAMVNMGIYGIVRVGSDLLGRGELWWWVIVLALGVVSALFGALHATTSTDLKRLLAYSTIDVMGLVLVGVGAAGALRATGHPSAAHLAFFASLLLVVAHASFKGCLFLSVGSVERATGTREIDRLGALIHNLPATTALFAVGTFSIIAIPTLSGFSSEWLLLQGLLHGIAVSSTATGIALLVGVAALALTGGLTAVAFVKAFGIGFLGQARSDGAAIGREVGYAMRVGTALLAVPCVVLGLAPGSVASMLSRAATGFASTTVRPVTSGLGLNLAGFNGAIEPVLLLAALGAALGVTWLCVRLLSSRSTRRAETWGCGRELQTARMQYTATSFAEPLERVFVDVLRPNIDVEVSHATESKYFEQSLAYESHTVDAIERSIYAPMSRGLARLGDHARRVQNGSVHRYLAFGLVALIVVLMVLA